MSIAEHWEENKNNIKNIKINFILQPIRATNVQNDIYYKR